MNLELAVTRLRAIQADLDAGRLTVPYPEPIRRELMQLVGVCVASCGNREEARVLVAQIQAPEPINAAELPW